MTSRAPSDDTDTDALYQLTFEHAHVGIGIVDGSGRFVRVNRRLSELTGYEPAELVGHLVTDFAHPDDDPSWRDKFLRVARGESRSESYDRRYVRKDGSIVYAHVTLSGGPAGSSGLRHVVGVVEDVTVSRRNEIEARRHAAQQAALAQIGSIALANASLGFVFEQTAEIVRDMMQADRCEIHKVEGDDLILVSGAGFSLPPYETRPDQQPSHTQYALSLLEPVVVDDMRNDPRFAPTEDLVAAGILSAVIVAIDGGEAGAWGTISTLSKKTGAFTQQVVPFLRSVALTLGQIIHRRHIEVELRVRAAQQSAIADLGRLAASDSGPALLQHACELAMEGLSVEYSSFLVPTEDGLALHRVAGHRWSNMPELIADSGGGLAFTSGKAVVVNDIFEDPRFAHLPYYAPFGIRAGIAVPVQTPDKKFGVLTGCTRLRKRFTQADVHFMESLASLVVEALAREASRTELIESERRYRSVVEGASEIIFAVNARGEITGVNRAFEVITGYRVDEWVGKPFMGLIAPEDRERIQSVFRSVLTKPGAITLEVSLLAKDGQRVLLDASASPRVIEGEVVEVYGFARDITEQRKMEEERTLITSKLEQANRLSSLGRLAATVAHEFNNVLMGIAPFVDLLRRESLPERATKSVEQISSSVKRGKRITEDILRFTQPAQPVLGTLNLRSWLATIAAEGRSLLGSRYPLDIAVTDDLEILGDPNQLHQTLVNLLLNARDAMPGGGTITIRANRNQPDARFPFGAVVRPERFAQITVEDTGQGIAPETLRHIFEPLFTTKKNGTGLGLPVARQVVTRHGGEIFAESVEGQGAKFHLFIPLAAEAVTATTPANVSPMATRRPYSTVLLVEDERAVGAGLAALLEIEGIAVHIVEKGRDVLPAIDKVHPDAVILDIGLPDMDGTMVYAEIAKSHPTLPVVFSSGHGDKTKLEHHLANRHVSFLLKPYDIDTLLQTLDRVVE
jgi:two-component system, cell cycle sensor histidine kinase and response regulator CckA